MKVGALSGHLTENRIGSPALLKLDAQGYKPEALRGCAALLRRFAFAYCECSFVGLREAQSPADEVIACICETSFNLRDVHNTNYDAKVPPYRLISSSRGENS